MTKAEAIDLTDDFSFDDLNSADTADMRVIIGGKPSNWIWTFAGPGHDKTIAQSNRLSRERLHENRLKEQAVVNGKKWKAPDETVDDMRLKNVDWVVERIIDWTPVRIEGELFAFSPDNARKLLLDPKKANLLTQALEFLTDDNSFTKRSA